MVILCADDWICIFVLFLVWMRHLAQVLLLGDAGSCILLVSFVEILMI